VYENGITFTANEMKLHVEASRDVFEFRYYDFSMIRVQGGVGEPYGIFCHMIDVSERVITRLALEQNSIALANTIKELEKERGLREQFVATLTHDLRTPLTSAMMNAQILARKPIDYSNVKILAERIAQSMIRADQMIEDLLDVGRIKAGETLPLDIQPCILNEIAHSTVADLTTVYGNRFVIQFSGNLNGFWDESALRRVIENLASNAVKYGKTRSAVTIHLGLTLVKGISEAHGGDVHVQSSESAGTTFSVRLPRKKITS
jgi:signal transduction histidine kinase